MEGKGNKMRVIFMRHGESQNNVYAKMDRALYEEKRTFEPELSTQGVQDCRDLGSAIKDMGLNIDCILTSAHKRAILSARNVRETFIGGPQGGPVQATSTEEVGVKVPPVHLFIKIHEKGGIYQKEKCFGGLNPLQATALLPDLHIAESQDKLIDESGWWRSETIETKEQTMERAKEVVREFKEMAKEGPYAGKTILAVSHGAFLHTLFCLLSGGNNKPADKTDMFIPLNNSLAIVDFETNETFEGITDAKLLAYNL